jgi:ubiquinone/menaquinone biosynthesis C-methylase UbiE
MLNENNSISAKWNECLDEEVAFWENYLSTKGAQWKEEFARRTSPNSQLQDVLLRWIGKEDKQIKILDVGAGPLTQVNKKTPSAEIIICAVDPLADKYNALLEKYGISPIVKTEKCQGEKLTERFPENSFDLVYSRNALDHSYNPIKCLAEMIAVCKPQGHIILQQHENEGMHVRWAGLHQWNFYLKRKYLVFGQHSLFLGNITGNKVNLNKHFSNMAQMIYAKREREERMITTVYKKIAISFIKRA